MRILRAKARLDLRDPLTLSTWRPKVCWCGSRGLLSSYVMWRVPSQQSPNYVTIKTDVPPPPAVDLRSVSPSFSCFPPLTGGKRRPVDHLHDALRHRRVGALKAPCHCQSHRDHTRLPLPPRLLQLQLPLPNYRPVLRPFPFIFIAG